MGEERLKPAFLREGNQDRAVRPLENEHCPRCCRGCAFPYRLVDVGKITTSAAGHDRNINCGGHLSNQRKIVTFECPVAINRVN